MIHRNRHEQRRRNELLLHLTRVVCFHDKRLKVARRRQRHVSFPDLNKYKQPICISLIRLVKSIVSFETSFVRFDGEFT